MQVLRDDCWLTVPVIASHLDNQNDNACKFNTGESRMQKHLGKVVPRLLNSDEKNFRIQMCNAIIALVQVEQDLVWEVITGGRTRILQYDQEPTHRSCP